MLFFSSTIILSYDFRVFIYKFCSCCFFFFFFFLFRVSYFKRCFQSFRLRKRYLVLIKNYFLLYFNMHISVSHVSSYLIFIHFKNNLPRVFNVHETSLRLIQYLLFLLHFNIRISILYVFSYLIFIHFQDHLSAVLNIHETSLQFLQYKLPPVCLTILLSCHKFFKIFFIFLNIINLSYVYI